MAITTPIPAPDGWTALRYSHGEGAADYTCPRCHRAVTPRSQHVVAWPEDETSRRHWHTACWTSAVKEGIDRYRWG